MTYALPSIRSSLQDLEKVLDVFNITLARQQAQMEVTLASVFACGFEAGTVLTVS